MPNALGVLLPGFVGTDLPEWVAVRLRSGLAGVCLFGGNIVDAAQTRRLTDAIRAAKPDAIIAIDEEGGDVTRLHHATGSPYPGAAILGRIDDVGLTAEVARSVAREVRAVGANLDFAPDADVNSDPDNPVIGVRSFGADAELVARHVAAWVAACESEGIATSAKHFPGHGDTAVDSHHALPTVAASADELARRDLPPFRAAIAACARTVMSSHILVPALGDLPATFSSRILRGVLRGELGFEGVIVSDALDMRGASGDLGLAGAAVAAIEGGCDLLCLGTRTTDEQVGAIAEALGPGTDPARLTDAEGRVAALAGSLAGPSDATDATPLALDADRIRAAFDVRPGLRIPTGVRPTVVSAEANIAVGAVPWGLAAAGAAVERVAEGDPLPGDGPWILVGRANHTRPGLRALADEARRRDPRSVVVDMGWPSPDRTYADIATFGASRAVGAALASLLAG